MHLGKYADLVSRFVAWAGERDDLRAAVAIGSRVRDDRPADEFSDLDLLLFATDPDAFIDGDDWTRAFGDPILSFVEGTATGDRRERRVLFAGGLDVDFVPLDVSEIEAMLAGDGVPDEFADVLGRGHAFLLDEDGYAERFATLDLEPPESGPALPTEDEFAERVADFWYHALWSARKLARGELWTAKGGLDGYAKRECLLPMVEWHARAANGVDGTWHEGRFLETWADERVLADLEDSFARYDREDVERALLATMDLFRWVARETAETAGYDYPEEADERVSALVSDVLDQADGSL